MSPALQFQLLDNADPEDRELKAGELDSFHSHERLGGVPSLAGIWEKNE